MTLDPPVPLARSVAAVLAGFVVASVLPELLETTLVRAAAGEPLADLSSYFTVRNRPPILAAKVVSSALMLVLAGYFVAKLAGSLELGHAALAALVYTASTAWGFTMGEYASSTPLWARALIVVAAPVAMLAGASVRRRARLAELSAASMGRT